MSQAVLTTTALPAFRPRVRVTALVDRLGIAGMVAAITLGVIVLVAVLAPVVAPYDPNEPDLLNVLSNPSAAHWFGTDALGRDILSRLIWGARLTLAGPGLVILLSTIVGTLLALTAAWFRGRVDTAISWVLDVMFAVPGIVFALIAVALFGPSFGTVVAGLTIAYIPYVARVVRGGGAARTEHALHLGRLAAGAARLLDHHLPAAAEPGAAHRGPGRLVAGIRGHRPGRRVVPGPGRAATDRRPRPHGEERVRQRAARILRRVPVGGHAHRADRALRHRDRGPPHGVGKEPQMTENLLTIRDLTVDAPTKRSTSDC